MRGVITSPMPCHGLLAGDDGVLWRPLRQRGLVRPRLLVLLNAGHTTGRPLGEVAAEGRLPALRGHSAALAHSHLLAEEGRSLGLKEAVRRRLAGAELLGVEGALHGRLAALVGVRLVPGLWRLQPQPRWRGFETLAPGAHPSRQGDRAGH
eukprot:CAMPEP_0195057748 /NCGR_PEP_ID=MMETSP0448-20130528/5803_1 /TAXON_ID=66468 /ORGANISM="Heterocapsa triquestra, Strain CCMP 448" /LENGTH=150 /DNA_ID=CAMNT_0040087789 /DNA_START=346 /DNA_END=798 /DNA_ORIENTATION=-